MEEGKMRPLLLDTYCKAGGTSMGYHMAGFEVIGVDIEPQKRYPFEFHQSDAIEFILRHGKDFDVIAGSPPCQGYSVISVLSSGLHPMLIPATRQAMQKTGRPYIIENVKGARFKLDNPIMLCGTMFGLKVIRHRYFECNPTIWFSPRPCQHKMKTGKRGEYDNGQHGYMTVVGHNFNVEKAKTAMGIGWMTGKELSQAIPPVYTKWLGGEIRKVLKI